MGLEIVTARAGSSRMVADPRLAQRKSVLARHLMFTRLSERELDRLANQMRMITFGADETIFSKGEPGQGLMAVVTGLVRISSPASDGREITLNFIHPGEVFGEVALFDGRPRTANATTLKPTEIFALDRREFIPFIAQNPEAALGLLAVLSERLRRTSEQVEDALFLDMPTRLAKLILRLAEQNEREPTLIRATQKDLGQMIGLSRESTNKHLRAWERQGWVKLDKGAVRLLNVAALQAFSFQAS